IHYHFYLSLNSIQAIDIVKIHIGLLYIVWHIRQVKCKYTNIVKIRQFYKMDLVATNYIICH
ncbi:hypothetical protein C0J52_26297, partial [Blattella germanica]